MAKQEDLIQEAKQEDLKAETKQKYQNVGECVLMHNGKHIIPYVDVVELSAEDLKHPEIKHLIKENILVKL